MRQQAAGLDAHQQADAQLLDAVKLHWDDIRFTTPDGKRIQYTAVLETDFGAIEIALRPDVAPNQVRSFVALIQAGYYNGMRFDRIHHEVSSLAPNDRPLDFVEAGCPLDNGDPRSTASATGSSTKTATR